MVRRPVKGDETKQETLRSALGRDAANLLILAAIATSAAAIGASPCDAAVRLCRAFVVGDLISDQTEKAAKRRALESWTSKAQALEKNASWHIAAQKALTCAKAADKSYQCLARGYPCTIRQAPPGDVPTLKAPGRGA